MLNAMPVVSFIKPMNALDTILDEIVTRNRTRKLNTSFIRAEFHRKCCVHFENIILPQLQAFESHLNSQGVSITLNTLHQHDKNVLQADLAIEYPAHINNFLQIRYDFRRMNTVFNQVIGNQRGENTIDCHSFDGFDKVTSIAVYDVIEYFAQSVFGSKLK
jgi:hypothetical protein